MFFLSYGSSGCASKYEAQRRTKEVEKDGRLILAVVLYDEAHALAVILGIWSGFFPTTRVS